jgi:hypothetical protein
MGAWWADYSRELVFLCCARDFQPCWQVRLCRQCSWGLSCPSRLEAWLDQADCRSSKIAHEVVSTMEPGGAIKFAEKVPRKAPF